MLKTKEELGAIKEEVEALNVKLAELTGEELAQVAGGGSFGLMMPVVPVGEPDIDSLPQVIILRGGRE